MQTFIYFIFLSEVLKNYGLSSTTTNNKQTFLFKNKTRTKRFLIFEKGATITVQGNIAKSIIHPAPRGLNMITEYTLSYDLPSDIPKFQSPHGKTTKEPATTTHYFYPQQHMFVPYTHDYYFQLHPEYLLQRSHSRAKKTCWKRKFYEYNSKSTSVCLKRVKRHEDWSLAKLSVSQRMFYDLIEKWSLLHGFLPRYCFMRTLCESTELLLPYGYSLLHDIIHIMLRYTKPWTIHHKIFDRSLRHWHSIDECAKLYGPYCRVSWLSFITHAVYASTRVADFMI